MDKKSFVFTSRPISDTDTQNYHQIISDSVQNGVRKNGSPVKVECATRIADQNLFVYIEITADDKLDAATMVRKRLNELFQDTALFPLQ